MGVRPEGTDPPDIYDEEGDCLSQSPSSKLIKQKIKK